MKKLLFAIAAVAVTMTACKKDETDDLTKNENPVITITSLTGTTVEAGSALELRVSVRANDDGDKLKTFAVTRGDETLAFFSVSDINETSLDTVVYVAASSAFETTVFTAVASDKNNNIAAKTISIATVSGFSSEVSGAFFHVAGLLEGAYDLVADANVASSGDEASKDMKNTDAAGVAFTGSWASGTGNATTYMKANGLLDFDTAVYSDLAATYVTGVATVTAPQADDLYIAKLRGGTDYALIKITANDANFSTGTGGNKGKLTFDYKK